MHKICFVILHYKDHKVTDDCVQSILRMEESHKIEIVIVDNDIQESQERRQILCDMYQDNERIHIIRIRENGGFSYANNQGYRFARENLGADCILVLNNDIEFPQTDFLRRLEKAYQNHPCQILGPDVIRKSTGEHQNPLDTKLRTEKEATYTIRMNRLCLKCYPLVYPILYLQNRYEENKQKKAKTGNQSYYCRIHEYIVPFGACLIYTPLYVEKEKRAFYPETKFYYEEYLLAARCQKKGYKVVYDPVMKVYHESGKATKQTFGSMRNKMKFVMENTMNSSEIYLKYLRY
ncbi:MAG: glycosyltransferase [Lachnospiraceae bacterium]|nr:glycosyltransferase [Lachnospiraceae bacterium]